MAQAQSATVDNGTGKLGRFASAFRSPLSLAASGGAGIVAESKGGDVIIAVSEPAIEVAAGPEIEVIAETRDQSAQLRDNGAMLAHIRHSIAALRTSEQRVADLKAGLAAVTERAKNEIQAANARAENAEQQAAREASRADAAERRWQQSEDRISEILQIIANELEPAA